MRYWIKFDSDSSLFGGVNAVGSETCESFVGETITEAMN